MSDKEYKDCVVLNSDILYRYSIMMVRNHPLAQDIVQESFLSLWINRNNVDFAKSKGYLIRTAYYIVVSWRRKNDVKTKYKQTITEYKTENSYNGVEDAVNYYLQLLPDFYKDVLILKDMQGYSYEEIAQMTDSSLEKIKVTVYRARKRMKELIGKKENII
ncbi:MAG: RNA polymerase sigma factor [Bacteroidales bacterium]|nr:RNA polymerase sigma factor [Bacteroidales bacterium]